MVDWISGPIGRAPMARHSHAQPASRVLIGEFDRDVAVGQLGIELHDELVDDLLHYFLRRWAKEMTASETVAELGQWNSLLTLPYHHPRACAGEAISRAAMSAAPAFVVMMMITLRKSTCLPLWSVSFP